jgi:hypothetical protein
MLGGGQDDGLMASPSGASAFVGGPDSFRIVVAGSQGLALELDGSPVEVEPGCLLLANPGANLVMNRESAGSEQGRLFIVPEIVFRRLASSLTTGKGGLVRFVKAKVTDAELAAMMTDIHNLLLRDPNNRRGEALFVGAVASLLRQYGQIGGVPAASPLKAAPTGPAPHPARAMLETS